MEVVDVANEGKVTHGRRRWARDLHVRFPLLPARLIEGIMGLGGMGGLAYLVLVSRLDGLAGDDWPIISERVIEIYRQLRDLEVLTFLSREKDAARSGASWALEQQPRAGLFLAIGVAWKDLSSMLDEAKDKMEREGAEHWGVLITSEPDQIPEEWRDRVVVVADQRRFEEFLERLLELLSLLKEWNVLP
jgi:hypothetical protein